ncbi:winged helix-turn-helix transcriptional regulator [Cetobacterium sp.]|uniref:winged helix-turn-helix transcriptional regulator n=1 Tax=Cetobacterium sp. TaxID=2071632 RepID=UPI003F2D70C6
MKNKGLEEEKYLQCPIEFTMDKIVGKRKLVILWHIYDKKVIRYGELKNSVYKISHKMLSDHLKELVNDGIISKKIYPEIPPKVEYSLTKFGETLIPIMDILCKWGIDNQK